MDSRALAEIERAAASRKVCACAECAACAGDDDGAHVVVGVGARERIEQLVLHAPGVGIQLVGAVQGQREDAVCDFVLDV